MKLTEEDISLQNIGFGREIFIRVNTKEDGNGMRTKEHILQRERLWELVEEELKKCDEDYNRYEEPVGWQNVPITGQIESVLSKLLDKAKEKE